MAWLSYTLQKRHSRIPDDRVTITPRGSIGLAVNLCHPDIEQHFAEVRYDPDRRILRVDLVAPGTPGAFKFHTKRRCCRFEPIGALKQWGILPEEKIRCLAGWQGSSLLIQLPWGQPTPQEARDSRPAPAARAPARPAPTRKKSPIWVGKATCPRCGKRVAYRLLGSVPWCREHTAQDGTPCPRAELPEAALKAQNEVVPPAPKAAPDTSKFGTKWSGRTKCPVCGKQVAYRFMGDPGEGAVVLRGHRNHEGNRCPAEQVELGSDEPPAESPPAAGREPSPGEFCHCAGCGGRFSAVRRSDGVRPVAHRVNGKICKGLFVEALP